MECDSCIRYLEMKYLLDNSGIPQHRQQPTMLTVNEDDYTAYCKLADIKDNMTNFVTDGCNLLICSENTGNGKTTWAIKLLLKYFDNIWAGNGCKIRGMFVHVPSLLLQLKDFNNPLENDYKKNLMECDIVVWDDIAGSTISAYDYSQLLSYIDYRFLVNKSNILTSNCTNKESFEESLGSKLASRIWNTSTIIKFKGNDRRR
jgi:DNA replication protein DnaC